MMENMSTIRIKTKEQIQEQSTNWVYDNNNTRIVIIEKKKKSRIKTSALKNVH